MTVTAVCGAQFGSEGKGLIVGELACEHDVHVRVGAANAGHTVYVHGRPYTLQQLPVAAYANPAADLALGPGALISPDVLAREVAANTKWRRRRHLPPLSLRIDPRAHVITAEHRAREAAGDLARRIGSTSARAGEGIGEAQAARVRRDADTLMARDWRGRPASAELADIPAWLADQRGRGVLLEGAQGAGLSNVTGAYPYVTSRDTTAASLAADCGIGPRDLDRVVLVARTFPIRVAGNSGPFWEDSRELTWGELGLPAERTSVTGLVRRVATFSLDQVDYAARLNGATDLALTFADYLDPRLAGQAGSQLANELYDTPAGDLVVACEQRTRVPVHFVGTGPATVLRRESDADPARRADLNMTLMRLRLPLLDDEAAAAAGRFVQAPDALELRRRAMAA